MFVLPAGGTNRFKIFVPRSVLPNTVKPPSTSSKNALSLTLKNQLAVAEFVCLLTRAIARVPYVLLKVRPTEYSLVMAGKVGISCGSTLSGEFVGLNGIL